MTTREEFQTRLGEEIRRLRMEKEISQETLGRKIGVHRNTLARYESGDDIPIMVFLRICVALGTHGRDVLERILTIVH